MGAFLKKERSVLRKKKQRIVLSALQKQLLAGFALMVCVGLFLYLVWLFTRIESFQIRSITVVGGETIPHALIEEKANVALSGTYFALIPKRFSPLYPRQGIEESIRTIPRIKNIKLERTEDQSLTIVFDEYIPYALWCQEETSADCLFIDRNGYAFAPAPALEGSAFVRYITDEHVPEVGQTGFYAAFVKETETFIALLEEHLSLYVTHVRKVGDYDVEYTISGGGLIKVSQAMPMEKSFENLETILLSDEFKHIAPGSFQYIDLRFGEKIFVNESTEISASSTATSTNPF